MDFFDRHKALIITSLLCSVLVLALYNFSLSNNNQKARELLVDLDNFKIEEPVEEQEPEEEVPEEVTNRETALTHQAYNENLEARAESLDRQLQEIFEKNSAAQEETAEEESSETSGTFNYNSKKETEQKRSDGDQKTQLTSTKTGGLENSSITFSLLGRTAVNIPNPIYTCDRPGRVVVNITVDEAGNVLTTSINKAGSSSNNECLTEQAMQYASRAVFSRLAGRNGQPGTITYNFKP